MLDYFHEFLAEKQLLIVPCEGNNGIVQIAESTLEPSNHASIKIVDTEKKVIQLADSNSMLYDAKNEKSFQEFSRKITTLLFDEEFQFNILKVCQQSNESDCSSLMLFNWTLAVFHETLSDLNDYLTDELRISQILALDENEICKNWLAVEVPEKTLNQLHAFAIE